VCCVWQVNKPASLCVDMATAAEADELSASVVSPSQHECDAIVQLIDIGDCVQLQLISSSSSSSSHDIVS